MPQSLTGNSAGQELGDEWLSASQICIKKIFDHLSVVPHTVMLLNATYITTARDMPLLKLVFPICLRFAVLSRKS